MQRRPLGENRYLVLEKLKVYQTTTHGTTWFFIMYLRALSTRKMNKKQIWILEFCGPTCSGHESVCSLTTGAKNDRIFQIFNNIVEV
jgi:hypothetical protein